MSEPHMLCRRFGWVGVADVTAPDNGSIPGVRQRYLRVTNFWKYQNADVWKKSRTHPPWYKHFVHRDRELDALPIAARLLWVELLGAATRYSNVLQADLNWIWAETRIDPEDIREALPLLLKGGWLSETATTRRSRKPSRENLDDPREQEEDKDGEQEQENPSSTTTVNDPRAVTELDQATASLEHDQAGNGTARDHQLVRATIEEALK